MVRGYHHQFQQLSSNVKIFLAGNAIQAVGLSIYTLLFNLYLKELGYGEASIGNMISTTSFGISLMAIPAALIMDKFHVKHLVITGLLLSSVFYFLQILNVSESALFGLGLLASMFQALFNISVSPFYLRNSSPKERMHLFTINSGLSMFAALVGYAVGGFLPATVGHFYPDMSKLELYRTSLMMALSVVFLSNFVFLRIRRVPIPRVKKRFFDGIKEKDWKVLGKLIIPKLCFAFGGGLIVPFMNLYLKERFDLSTRMIGLSYAFLQLCIFAGIFITPLLMKRTTQLKFITSTAMASIPFMIMMGLGGNIALVLGCFFFRGMLMNMSSPITSMFEMEHVKEHDCMFASATILFFYHIVYMSSTRLGGFLIEKYSFGPTFFMAAFFYGLAVFLYQRFFRKEDEIVERNESSFVDVEAA